MHSSRNIRVSEVLSWTPRHHHLPNERALKFIKNIYIIVNILYHHMYICNKLSSPSLNLGLGKLAKRTESTTMTDLNRPVILATGQWCQTQFYAGPVNKNRVKGLSCWLGRLHNNCFKNITYVASRWCHIIHYITTLYKLFYFIKNVSEAPKCTFNDGPNETVQRALRLTCLNAHYYTVYKQDNFEQVNKMFKRPKRALTQ